MMEEKRTFFASLEPKSAMIVGIITGVLTLCTIGFIVLSAIMLSNGDNSKSNVSALSGGDNSAGGANAPEIQVPKSDKPKVELFVMSYCPFGLQMQKAYLPVMELLQDEAEMDIKFVSYIMHEKQEIDENTRQYCIQKEQNGKFIDYLKCFTGKDDYKGCLKASGVNEASMNACIAKADKDFGISVKYEDRTSWLNGRFPVYPIHADLNQKYSVQGSPTLIVNGVEVSSARNPEAVKQLVCASFNNPPDLCEQVLSAAPASSGFGTGVGTDNASAGCGG